MNTETVRMVRITAQEIKEKFGLKGDIVAFHTPSRQEALCESDKHVLIKLVVGGKQRKIEE